jgi:ABC-type multidrug transport system ATPase subunit
MLEVNGLRGGYREGVTVFDDISFSLDGGAIGFIGRNGAGKTCLA